MQACTRNKSVKEVHVDKKTHLIWLDLEMTGLIPERDTIIEIATIVTDQELNVLAQGPVIAIHQPDAILDAMDEWNQEHHTRSGLVSRVRTSHIEMAEAEAQTLAFLQAHTLKGTSPLCGNTIGQDRLFLRRYMPTLEAYFHYRNVDVSTIKELVRRWYPPADHAPPKQNAHLALDDIKESIEELRHYRTHIFRPPSAA